MSELDLSEEEQKLVASLARDNASKASRLGFYAAALVPALVFGGYGLAKSDLVALGLAFVGLFFFVGWHISQELQYLNPSIGVFKKIAAHEKRAAAHAQQGIQADTASPRRLT